MSVIYQEIQPSNVNSTQKVSYKQGNPIVSFLIGAQPHLLDGSSVRISGDINFYKDANKTKPTTADELAIDEKLAIYSIIMVVSFQPTFLMLILRVINYLILMKWL